MQSAHVRASRRHQLPTNMNEDDSFTRRTSIASAQDRNDKYEKQAKQQRLQRLQRRREKELRREKQLAVISIVLLVVLLLSITLLYFVWRSKASPGKDHSQHHSPNPLLDYHHASSKSSSSTSSTTKKRDVQRQQSIFDQWSRRLKEVDDAVISNRISKSDILLNPNLLVSLDSSTKKNPLLDRQQQQSDNSSSSLYPKHGPFFRISRMFDIIPWQIDDYMNAKPTVDYTDPSLYEYLNQVPIVNNEESSVPYPKLITLHRAIKHWPQDEIDHPPLPIQETLHHFDYSNSRDLEQAWNFIDEQLPFKLTNVPEILQANQMWTDEYVGQQFDTEAIGNCQESPTSFFPFYDKRHWNVETMGLPPTRNNDFTFATWAKHARYADATQLSSNRPHFYWQAGIPREERFQKEESRSFISRHLPCFSSIEPNVMCPEPSEAKGIQCRFGERGITAANHFDAGQNMIAMISGAKRYILSPPNQCSKLGIVTERGTAMYRHSLLNFERLGTTTSASQEEKEWLERAGTAMVVETVLKAGEVLFVPSHWFHYIIGLQKNAQCNVRSGVNVKGSDKFGGQYAISPKGCHAANQ